MLPAQELESLQRRLSASFWLFLAAFVIEFTLSLSVDRSVPLKALLFSLLGYVIFFGGYVVYALACVRTAKALGRSGGLTTAYFIGLPLAVLAVSIVTWLLAAVGLATAGTIVGLVNTVLQASPIAFYISLRSGLSEAHHDAIFAE